MCSFRSLVLLFLLHSAALADAQGSGNKISSWQTLSGNAPLVIARGGFSGMFPDSSYAAYSVALNTGLSNMILWCDVQLTKDSAGICFPNLLLDNSSDIAKVFTSKNKVYPVNGVPTRGWFSVDFTLNDLANVFLNQGIYSRTNKFDGNLFQILTVQDVAQQFRPPGLWLNIQHDAFYLQNNLSMRSFVLSVSRSVIVNYISSPEVNFLGSIYARFKPSKTKLVFRFMAVDDIEPSTNQTYGSFLKNLTFVKTFASGILVPKTYIWPVDVTNLYLQPHTSVVSDAHKEGLEVFASDFVNDVPLSYNYSYDPVAESVSFVDNGVFSVDGLVSDFPITASEAVGCFSHIGKNDTKQATPLVISYNGASGDYPGCTDLAYVKAIADGVDVLDCPVQMTKDGIPFCLSSINLIDSTTVVQSPFSNLTTSIPELKPGNGIFTFNLTWSEIQSLSPSISNPYSDYRLYRNPKFKYSGKFMTLTDFLALTKKTSLSGILISIEHAAYLAEQQGMSVTDEVLEALSKSGYDAQTAKKVMIQSTNSSVLMKFKGKNNYKLVYRVNEIIRDALNSTIEDIANFADSVVVSKTSIFPDTQAFLTGTTDVVAKLQSFKLPVYAQLFRNEFVSQAWDFFSDATVEINSYVMGSKLDGIITDFPKTAATYKKNHCLKMAITPPYMLPVQPGALMPLITSPYMPPAEAPFPVLTVSDVNEPPLPAVTEKVPTSNTGNGSKAPAPTSSSGQPKISACLFLMNLAIILATILLL